MGHFVVVFVLLAVMSFVEQFCKKNKNLLSIFAKIMLIGLVLASSLRGNNKADYDTYKEVFDLMTSTSKLLVAQNFFYEPIYSVIQWLCKLFVGNFQFMLFVLAVLVIGLEYNYADEFSIQTQASGEMNMNGNVLFGKESCHPGENYFTVFLILGGLYSANIFVIRSSVALCICLYSTKYIEQQNRRKFILLILLAVGFHYSALIFVPAYSIYKFHSDMAAKLLLFAASVFFLVLFIDRIMLVIGSLGGKIGHKVAAYRQGQGNSLLYATGMNQPVWFIYGKALVNIGFLIFLGIIIWKNYKKERRYEGYFNLYLFGCVLYISGLTVGYAFARIAIYYNVFQIPMMMYMVADRNERIANRKIYWIIICFYLLFRMVMNYTVPYIPFWKNA